MFPEPSGRRPFAEAMGALPPEWADQGLTAAIARRVNDAKTKIIVLDDDPTGTQTVHDVLVLTEWSQPTLRAALARPEPAIFILTNARSLPLAAAQAMNAEIARNLGAAAHTQGCALEVISRSDSTLRGHFPGEVLALRDGLQETLGIRYDGCIICAVLFEAGRYTLDNVHWVKEGDWLTPAGQTEFARDASFGYRSSDLRNWVAEKTGGLIAAASVVALSSADIRHGGPEAVARKLVALSNWGVAIANLASYQDVAVFVAGILQAEAQGKRFLFRTAASFVKVRAAISPQPFLTADKLFAGSPPRRGGLIVIGSYIQKSTEQAQQLLALPGVASLELSVERVSQPEQRQAEVARVVRDMNCLLPQQDVAVITSRQVKTGGSTEENLRIGQAVSAALVDVVRGLADAPRFIVAKGGITSSDVATKGLAIKQALVLGQIAAAVPVWRAGAGSRFPNVPYVVFPGNVGGPDTLAQVVAALRWGPVHG